MNIYFPFLVIVSTLIFSCSPPKVEQEKIDNANKDSILNAKIIQKKNEINQAIQGAWIFEKELHSQKSGLVKIKMKIIITDGNYEAWFMEFVTLNSPPYKHDKYNELFLSKSRNRGDIWLDDRSFKQDGNPDELTYVLITNDRDFPGRYFLGQGGGSSSNIVWDAKSKCLSYYYAFNDMESVSGCFTKLSEDENINQNISDSNNLNSIKATYIKSGSWGDWSGIIFKDNKGDEVRFLNKNDKGVILSEFWSNEATEDENDVSGELHTVKTLIGKIFEISYSVKRIKYTGNDVDGTNDEDEYIINNYKILQVD